MCRRDSCSPQKFPDGWRRAAGAASAGIVIHAFEIGPQIGHQLPMHTTQITIAAENLLPGCGGLDPSRHRTP